MTDREFLVAQTKTVTIKYLPYFDKEEIVAYKIVLPNGESMKLSVAEFLEKYEIVAVS